MRILVIEDDLILSDLLVNNLINDYLIDIAINLTKISNLLDNNFYQAILLSSVIFCDCQSKKCACKVFQKSQSPVLLMTTGEVTAHDYNYLGQRKIDFLHKPFNINELQLRLNMMLFQFPDKQQPALAYQNFLLDNQSRQLICSGNSLHLTKKEFYLMQLFFKRPKQLLSKSLLANLVWDDEEVVYGNSIAMHLSSLRKKIKTLSGRDLIKTVRGDGYLLQD